MKEFISFTIKRELFVQFEKIEKDTLFLSILNCFRKSQYDQRWLQRTEDSPARQLETTAYVVKTLNNNNKFRTDSTIFAQRKRWEGKVTTTG
jgi:hypothetical protein